MSLEQVIIDNTAAMNRNSDLIEVLIGRASGATGAGAGGAEKPAAKPAAKPRAPKEAKAPSEKDMKDAATKYLDVSDEDEYNARREKVKDICGKFGAAKFTEIAEDKRAEALELLSTATTTRDDGDDDLV